MYTNRAAVELTHRLWETEGIELPVMLLSSVEGVELQPATASQAVTILTAPHGQPLCLHLMLLDAEQSPWCVITVRELGAEREAVRKRYGLSEREAQVVELVLRGYSNADIGSALSITPATAKKHLTRIFDKLGVDSRAQLISRLA